MAGPSRTQSQSRFHYLGQLSYSDGLQAQERARAAVLAGEHAAEVLGLEHEPVVTLGKRGRTADDLYCTADELNRRGLELHRVDRGGQATLHSPGQLVIYPCVHLKRIGCGIRDFVRGLEACTQAALAELGIAAALHPDEPGLYTGKGKIAFFGLKVSNEVTSHGLAVNVANDLGLFALIRSCGRHGESFDRVADSLAGLSPEALYSHWIRCFRAQFEL